LGEWHVALRALRLGVSGFEILVELVEQSLGDFGALEPLEQKLTEPTGRERRRVGRGRTGHWANARWCRYSELNPPDGFAFNLERISERWSDVINMWSDVINFFRTSAVLLSISDRNSSQLHSKSVVLGLN
jgi:hypothetical protein